VPSDRSEHRRESGKARERAWKGWWGWLMPLSRERSVTARANAPPVSWRAGALVSQTRHEPTPPALESPSLTAAHECHAPLLLNLDCAANPGVRSHALPRRRCRSRSRRPRPCPRPCRSRRPRPCRRRRPRPCPRP
jgi:hypothetical protein